jgi:hypothetical protein
LIRIIKVGLPKERGPSWSGWSTGLANLWKFARSVKKAKPDWGSRLIDPAIVHGNDVANREVIATASE